MWILKLHFAFSILCALTYFGFGKVFKEEIRKNGWLEKRDEKKKFLNWLYFLVPILNVLFVLALFVMIAVKKDDLPTKEDSNGKEEN